MATLPTRVQPLTFILWGEVLHGRGQGLVEPVLAGDEGLAHGMLVVGDDAQVAPDLVQEGFQGHAHLAVRCGIQAVLHHHVATQGGRVVGRRQVEGTILSSLLLALVVASRKQREEEFNGGRVHVVPSADRQGLLIGSFWDDEDHFPNHWFQGPGNGVAWWSRVQ